MSDHSFDVTDATFEQDVVERSRRVPVLVDFWAPWCAPCQALKPVLERLAAEYEGRFALAKINTDENPEVASRYGVRGIPDVKAFVDGEVADEFTGALPEAGVRRFLEGVMPSPAALSLQAARDAIAAGDFDAAEAQLREALAQDPGLHDARVDLAELLLARRSLDAAAAALAAVPEGARDERAARLGIGIALEQKRSALPDAHTLAAAVKSRPADAEARLAFAERLAADGALAPALEELIEVVRRERGPYRERARKAALDLFALAADHPELVGEYRRKLAAALY